MDPREVTWGPVVAAAGTVVGNRYDANYDVHFLDESRFLAVIADGMGDGPGSAFAGQEAVSGFARAAGGSHSPASLRALIAEIHRRVRSRPGPDLTGCTLTGFVGSDSESAWIVQIGDSRAYRLRDGILELLTVDHTEAWLGLLNGWYSHDSPEAHAARYRLFRYIGHSRMPEPDVLAVSLRPGDRYLLCTDGVSDQLPYERLHEALAAPPARAVASLLDSTLAAGGADNATAVVISVGG